MIPAPPDARVAFEAWRSRVTEGAWADEWHLRSMLRVLRPNLDTSGLEAFAATCAGPIDVLAVENNRDEHLPVLRRYDGRGNRIEAVDHHPTYHEIGRLAYRSGMMSRYAEPGNELETLGLVYLFAQQGEAGHACPMACTAGLIKILQSAGNPRPDWLERLLDPNYDTHFHGAQFMTEVQGGSDVGANTLRAVDAGDGWATLHGEKWFCSVIDANLYLVTARPEGAKPGTGGLSAYVVPRVLDDGRVNDLNIRRLKYKLGTRSMASAELDFVGARALRVGDFKLVLERVIDTSRLYNAVCSSGMIQRASREAWAYATNRRAFGQPILAFPTVARIVARLRTEAVGARALTLLLADLADREATSPGVRSDTEAGAVRMLVNLNKLWTSFHGTSAARDAIEVLGGNGAIEEFSVLPRLLRDSIVCEAWEGGHNVLCAQVLRDSQRLHLDDALFTWLEGRGADSRRLGAFRERWHRVLRSPDAAVYVRDLCEELRPIAVGAAIRSTSDDERAALAADHLEITGARGYDPLGDSSLSGRVAALVA